MREVATKKIKSIQLSPQDYQQSSQAYKKIGEILASQKKKKKKPLLKKLYGIWQEVNVGEKDFEEAKKSLFKTSL